MHIPENYLSPATCAVMTVAMAPVWVHAVKRVKEDIPKERMPLIGVASAFSFLGMMFNVPMVGGTTGHAVGGTLIALLLGPDAACIAVSVALLLQALLFGDGGILSFGANCFNMAFALPYLGYFIYKLICGKQDSMSRRLVGAGIGSYVGINAAALLAAIEFGIQPLIAHDAAGNALYCPYGLGVSIPAMMGGHLTIFGLAEVIFTVAILAFVIKLAPSMLKDAAADAKSGIRPIYYLIGGLIVAVPLGLLATGTAWGEWGADEISEIVTNGAALGYTPAGLESGWALESLMPDYTIGNMPEVVAYILSAIIGVALLVLIFRLVAATMKKKTSY